MCSSTVIIVNKHWGYFIYLNHSLSLLSMGICNLRCLLSLPNSISHYSSIVCACACMCVCCVCVRACMHVHVNKLVYFKFLYCQGNSRSTDILDLNRPVGYVAMVTQCIIIFTYVTFRTIHYYQTGQLIV